ncbi:MAG TPA: hypothetical protein VI454_16770 [Verrucomicrobiae bacterium]
MTENEALIHLQALVTIRQRLESTGGMGFQDRMKLDREISAARAQLPDRLLRLYDTLAKKYANPVDMVRFGACAACGCEVPAKTAEVTAQSGEILKCERCGRLLIQ